MNNLKLYKNLLFLLGILTTILCFTSCYKETYPKYVIEPEKADTTKWEDEYTTLGTIPNNSGPTINILSGTKWVLVKYMNVFATEYPNDTIHFISNNKYKVNSQVSEQHYSLNSLVGSTNYSLELDFFMSFGGSHYYGQVGQNFVQDGQINNGIFVDFYSNTKIKAWFIKI